MKKALFSWLQFHCLFLVMGRSTQVQKEGNAMKQSSFFTAILFLLCWSWALCGCGAEALYYGAHALGTADILLPEDGSGGPSRPGSRFLEEHSVGKSTVKVYLVSRGLEFIAYDAEGNHIESVTDKDSEAARRFLKMDPAKRPTYIHTIFRLLAVSSG